MKFHIFNLLFLFMCYNAFAQSSYEATMLSKISKLEADNSVEEFTALANDFSRIGNKEGQFWQPYYYAAFSTIQKGRWLLRHNDLSTMDSVISEANFFISKAENLSPNNGELFLLKKIASSLKMMVDPISRFKTDGQEAKAYLIKAKSLDPFNPRIALIEAEDMYFTPEQFGGSKSNGILLFKKANKLFLNYVIKSNLDPNWGKSEAENFANQLP